MRFTLAAIAATCLLAGCSSSANQPNKAPTYRPGDYLAAINDIARPQADRDADTARKPGELLAFAQVHSGEKIGDYIMGGGYVTRLLAIGVGSSGKVYAFQPTEFIARNPKYATAQDDVVKSYAGTVVAVRGPMADPGFPHGLDSIITVMNLHDLFVKAMPEGTAQRAIAALYASLRPGGTLVVVDNRAANGSGVAAADTLHRMDEAVATQMLEKAGFVLDEKSDLYANPDDPRTASVFDPGIRGRADKFALRLRKPA